MSALTDTITRFDRRSTRARQAGVYQCAAIFEWVRSAASSCRREERKRRHRCEMVGFLAERHADSSGSAEIDRSRQASRGFAAALTIRGTMGRLRRRHVEPHSSYEVPRGMGAKGDAYDTH